MGKYCVRTKRIILLWANTCSNSTIKISKQRLYTRFVYLVSRLLVLKRCFSSDKIEKLKQSSFIIKAIWIFLKSVIGLVTYRVSFWGNGSFKKNQCHFQNINKCFRFGCVFSTTESKFWLRGRKTWEDSVQSILYEVSSL